MGIETAVRHPTRAFITAVMLAAACAAPGAGSADSGSDVIEQITASSAALQYQYLAQQARVSAEAGDWARALDALQAIPAEQRTPQVQTLWRRAVVHTAIDRARHQAGQGAQRDAWQSLWEAEAQLGQDQTLIAALAFAYAEVGAPTAAVALIREHLRGGVSSTPALHLHYAGLLFQLGDYNGFGSLMDRLGQIALNDEQRAHYVELRHLRDMHEVETLRAAGRIAEAETALQAVLERRPEDQWAQDVLARLHLARERPEDAVQLYDELLAKDADNLDLIRGAAWAAVQNGERRTARRLASRALELAPEDAGVLLDMARLERAVGREYRAIRLYQRALTVQRREQTVGSAQWRSTVDELATLRSPHDAQLIAGVMPRLRNDLNGISQLAAVELPVEARIPLPLGWLSLMATPVRLDAGEFDGRAYTASVFGGGPLLALDTNGSLLVSPRGGSRYSRYARGVGYSMGYRLGGFSADIGVSPVGFMFEHVVGGLRYESTWGRDHALWYAVSVERRAVTDSVLSWGGVFDPRGGGAWGGVVRSGGMAQMRYDTHGIRLDGHIGYDRYEGESVLDNRRLRAGAGASKALIDDSQRSLRVGLAASWQAFDNNQHHFTWGHGGYYSPQNAWWIGAPVEWAWRDERLSYRLDAALGLQSIREDAVGYFPMDAGMQTQAEAVMRSILAGVAGFGGQPVHRTKDQLGLGLHLGAAMEYRLSGRWVLGSQLAFDNGDDYSQWNGALYLRYFTTPGGAHLTLPVMPLSSPYVR